MGVFRLTHDAKASMMGIARYTQQNWGVKQRNTYMRLIDDCFHALAISPMQGKSRLEIHHALRSYPVEKHVVFYMMKKDYIVIVTVLPKHMDPYKNLRL